MGSKVSTTSNKSSSRKLCFLNTLKHWPVLHICWDIASHKQIWWKFVLDVGGFGNIYQRQLEDGIQVAVKWDNTRFEQGLPEFQTEIEMLSKFYHRPFISLIGYCDEHFEMILVYEYIANGTL